MTSSPRLFYVAASAVLISLGAAGFWAVDRLVMHPIASPPASAPADASAPPLERDAFVQLTAEMSARAGIETTASHTGKLARVLRSPGSVAPNAYRQTIVSALAGGTIIAVRPGLGDAVRDGQILIEMFTREHAEAEHMLQSAQTALDVAQKRRERAEKLVAIGGVSQQELDDERAEESRQFHAVDEAAARLRLLGPIRAPEAGVVTSRDANAGQNVQAGMPLLTLSDLSTVWVMAEIYERDLASVRAGTPARVTSRAYPGQTFTGKVTYLDPQISPETRTLKARVEVANSERKLRFGLLVDVEFDSDPSAVAMLIPRSAVQQIGSRAVVFVADPSTAHRFEAREVQVGASSGDDVEVKSGLLLGERVVTSGSFALRAEWERKAR